MDDSWGWLRGAPLASIYMCSHMHIYPHEQTWNETVRYPAIDSIHSLSFKSVFIWRLLHRWPENKTILILVSFRFFCSFYSPLERRELQKEIAGCFLSSYSAGSNKVPLDLFQLPLWVPFCVRPQIRICRSLFPFTCGKSLQKVAKLTVMAFKGNTHLLCISRDKRLVTFSHLSNTVCFAWWLNSSQMCCTHWTEWIWETRVSFCKVSAERKSLS